MNLLSVETIDWVISKIGNFDYKLVVKTPFSEVWKIKNKDSVFYLKGASGSLFSEPEMMKLVSKIVGRGICPEVVGINTNLNLFLTKELGTITLREKFERDGFDVKHVAKSYELMQYVQRLMSLNIEDCLRCGTTDWRNESMTKEFISMLNYPNFREIYHMKQQEIDLAMNGIKVLENATLELASIVPGEFWSDDDFNDKNIVINGSSYGFLDLGETSIGLPIIGLYASLNSLKLKNSILEGSLDDIYLRDACLDLYGVPTNQYFLVWSICKSVYPVYSSLCLHRLIKNSSTELLLNPRYMYRMRDTLKELNNYNTRL